MRNKSMSIAIITMFSFMLILLASVNIPASFASSDDLVDLTGVVEQAEHVSDEEMSELRGGYIADIYFSLYFDSRWKKSEDAPDYDPADPSQVEYSILSGSIQSGDVQIQASVGGFNNSSGIFLITQVPGSYNIIHNNMIIQLAIVNIANKSMLGLARNALATTFGLH